MVMLGAARLVLLGNWKMRCDAKMGGGVVVIY